MAFHAHKTGNNIGLNDHQKMPSPSTKYLKTKLNYLYPYVAIRVDVGQEVFLDSIIFTPCLYVV